MDLLVEIIIYFLVILGLLTVCITIFEKIQYMDPIITGNKYESNYYIRTKSKDSYVEMNITLKNVSESEKIRIINAIEIGNFSDIYDIVDIFNIMENNDNIVEFEQLSN